MLDTWIHRAMSLLKGSGLLPQMSSDSRQNSGSLGSYSALPSVPSYGGGMQSVQSYGSAMPSVPSYGGTAPPSNMASRAGSLAEPQSWGLQQQQQSYGGGQQQQQSYGGLQQQQQQQSYSAPSLQQGYGAMYSGYDKKQ
jgi:hypothetical protein